MNNTINVTVYLAELPYGANVTGYTAVEGNTAQVIHKNTAATMLGEEQFIAALTDKDSYLTGDVLRSGESPANSLYQTNIVPALTDEIKEGIPAENVTGFAIRDTKMMSTTAAILIVVIPTVPTGQGGGTDTVDKSSLEAEIAKVTGDNAANYYQSDDRYNGKETSTNGFWADLTADGGSLANAQAVYDNTSATQAQVDAATETLSAAIARLIPTSQLNATELYEKIELVNSIFPPANASQYTANSWAEYRAGMDPAEAYLASLFADNGDATAVNIAANQSIADGYAADVWELALNNVLDKKLSTLGSSADLRLNDAKMAYTALKNLCNVFFNPRDYAEAEYTNDSWDAYDSAYEAAQAFLSSHDGTTLTLESGVNEAQSYKDAYQAFWDACYGLEGEKSTITVTLDVTDTFARINGIDHLEGGSYVLSLPAGTTLEGAAQAAGIDLPALWNSSADPSIRLGVYVNGIYTQYSIVQESFPGGKTSDIILNDGDRVLIARMNAPMAQSSSGAGSDVAGLGEVGSYIRYASFRQGGTELTSCEATAGAEFTLEAATIDAEAYNALPTHYNGRVAPLAGAEIYRSKAYATEAEARAAAADIATGVITKLDGTFSLKLYSAEDSNEGWYLLNILSGDTNPGLTNAPHLLVHVTDPDDLSDVRAQLKAQLDEVYKAYSNDFYTEDQLAQLQDYYNTACAVLEDVTASSGDLYAAYETAYEGITAIQAENEASLNRNLMMCRELLKWLPNAEDVSAGKVYNIDKVTLDQLFGDEGWYTRMTSYQKNQFSSSESSFISTLQGIYESSNNGEDLPAIPEFTVKIEIRDVDSGEIVDVPFFDYVMLNYVDSFSYNEDYDMIGWSMHDGSVTFDETTLTYTLPTDGIYQLNVTSGPLITEIENYGYTYDGSFEFSFDDHYFVYGVESGIPVSYTLREDTIKTVYVQSTDSLQIAKNAALAELEEAYNRYKRSDYTDDKWAELCEEYQKGVDNINSAETEDAIADWLSKALAAMEAVEKKAETSDGVPGWGADSPFNAGAQVGTVNVSVVNNKFPEGAFTGTILTRDNYPIGENDNMMTVILRALHDEGFTWEGTGGSAPDAYDIGYLAKIKKDGQEMGEFSGENTSGWMGTLNDFMVNEGLNMFTVASGKLGGGDEIALQFTQNLGVDLGGSWGSSDTTLASLEVSTGTLIPEFESGESGNTYDFALMISGSSAGVVVTPKANNINFMVKTFLNEKVTTDAVGNSYYRRSETITVRPGDVIYVGCGERAWPSMNKQGDEASAYTGTWYALHVISANNGADYVNELIAKLPAGNKITLSNYKNVLEQIAVIDQVKAALSSSEQAKVDTSTLEAARERAESFKAVDEVKALLAALPKSSNLSDSEVVAARRQIEAADAAYKALTDEQKGYITVGDVANYNELVERLTKLTPDTTAETITGSTATGDEVTVSAEEIKEAADENGSLAVETENGTVKLDAATLDKLAETGKDVVVSVTENEDGTVTVDVTVDGKTVDASVKVELPVTDEGQVLVIVNADGTEEIVKKSLVEDGTVYAELPAGATVKVIDNAMHFIDVADNAWYADEVEFASSHGLFQGVGNNKFAPAAPMTRAMLATVLYRLEDAVATGANPFADVADGTWYTEAVIWASAEGIVQGTGKGFEPNENITREQIATMLYRYAKTIGLDVSGSAALDKFSDGDKTSSWAKDAMQWAVSVGLFQGDDVGTLRPQGDATRAEVAALLMRMVKLIVK